MVSNDADFCICERLQNAAYRKLGSGNLGFDSSLRFEFPAEAVAPKVKRGLTTPQRSRFCHQTNTFRTQELVRPASQHTGNANYSGVSRFLC